MLSNAPSLCLPGGLNLNGHSATLINELDVPSFLSYETRARSRLIQYKLRVRGSSESSATRPLTHEFKVSFCSSGIICS
jgi:hypothetical protein